MPLASYAIMVICGTKRGAMRFFDEFCLTRENGQTKYSYLTVECTWPAIKSSFGLARAQVS
jgi:hypothetical protein